LARRFVDETAPRGPPENACDLDVRRLEIAVHHTAVMRSLQCIHDPPCDCQRIVDGDRPASYPIGGCLALHQLQHDRSHVRVVLDAADRCDVRVIQCREEFGFALKTRNTILISGKRVGEDLECDTSLPFRGERIKPTGSREAFGICWEFRATRRTSRPHPVRNSQPALGAAV
jgi:hypothetical protein